MGLAMLIVAPFALIRAAELAASPAAATGNLTGQNPSQVAEPAEIHAKLIQVRSENASELADEVRHDIQEDAAKEAKPTYSSAFTLVPDDRSNSVTVTGTEDDLKRIQEEIEKWDGIDLPQLMPKTIPSPGLKDTDPIASARLFRLRHVDAETLLGILKQITKSAVQPYSPYIQIIADDRSNSMVVYGTEYDLQQMRQIIAMFDVQLPKVHTESLFVEVTLAPGETSALEALGLTPKQIDSWGHTKAGEKDQTFVPHIPSSSAGDTISATMSGYLYYYHLTGNFDLSAVSKAAQADSRIRVVGAPSVTTVSGQNATIEIATYMPRVIPGDIQNAAAGNNVTTGVAYFDVGSHIQLTPFVDLNNNIYLQCMYAYGAVVGDQHLPIVDSPIFGQREASVDSITIKSGDVIMLGGWQITEHDPVKDPDGQKSVTKELIVFLKPTLVDTTPSSSKPAGNATVTTPAPAQKSP